MERHETRTGVAFEPVMVFPQGKFSTPAISALRASGYLAAVNTTCFPSYGEAEPLTIADFLRPAIMKFHGFPIFQRRYPRRLIDFAFDIFLWKPALIVQHHDDFRGGYRPFEEFVAGLHKLEPALSWGPLSEQLMESCMVRSVSERSIEVRFFTRQFKFKNLQTDRTAFTFSREEPSASAVSHVLVDGKSVPFSHHFVMQFMPGRTLHQALHSEQAAGRPLSLAVIRSLLYQVGTALNYAHRMGVIHRDVKPGNVMLNADGDAVVTDFGIAKVTADPSQTQTGTVVGSRVHQPRQCYAFKLTPASDQYGLGVLAYELLTGRVPFDGTPFMMMQAHTLERLPSIIARQTDCPFDLENAVERMLAKDPKDRFPDINAALLALQATPAPSRVDDATTPI